MKSFVKSALFAGFGVGCLALGSGAQQPAPTPPAAPAAAPPLFVTGQPNTATYVQAQTTPVPRNFTGRMTTTGDGKMLWSVYDAHDTESHKLAKQLADAKTETDKDKVRDKLKEHLNKAFDDRQKQHEKDIAALEEQVKKLKEMVAKRQDAKKEIIDDRMKQLEREAKGLGW